MASQQWRDRLRQELDRQGLPSEYVSRLVEELSDHATDILQENASMEAEYVDNQRMGSPEGLASFARSQFQRRTFAGRHPLLTFLAGPIFAILGTLVAICLTVFFVAWLMDCATGGTLSANDELGLPPSVFEMRIVQAVNLVVRFIPFGLSAWLFARLGDRAGLRLWSVGACGIITLMAFLFSSVVRPASGQAPQMWIIGVGMNFDLDQVWQATMPLALGLWLIWQHLVERSKPIAI
ncbi:MAG TPA: hypothetical protein VG826_31750 [Pirellulales bacterium]|nr:hypothetical protein [Pirellulales bacterium]